MRAISNIAVVVIVNLLISPEGGEVLLGLLHFCCTSSFGRALPPTFLSRLLLNLQNRQKCTLSSPLPGQKHIICMYCIVYINMQGGGNGVCSFHSDCSLCVGHQSCAS